MTRSIRAATRADLDDLVRFQLAMALESEGMKLDETTLRRGISALFDDPRKGAYRVVAEGDRLVGCMLVLSEWSDWRNAEVLWVHSVYVVPEARRTGVFESLYRDLEAEVRANPHLGGIRLYVDKRNHGAQAVYARLGMTKEHYELFEWLK